MTRVVDHPMSLRWQTLAWLLLGCSLTAQANEALGWLERMSHAVRDLNYEGVFVYLHGDQLESMRLLHGTADGREMERLISLNGPPREVVRDQHSVLRVLPEQRAISVGWRNADPSYHAILSRSPEELTANYEFALGERDRVAGRAVQVVVITPRDQLRYGQRLFLDAEHALPLKSELLDSDGRAVSQLMFTQLRVDPQMNLDWEVESEAEGAHYAWNYQPPAQSLDGDEDACDWRFDGLPAGFRITVHARRNGTEPHPPQEHFVLSDGLATLSVYIEEADPANPLAGGSRMGPMSVFGRVLAGHQITVVGEVPEETARWVASTVRRQEQRGAP